MCFPSERIVLMFDTSGCIYLLSTNSEVHVFGYIHLFILKYYHLGFTGV